MKMKYIKMCVYTPLLLGVLLMSGCSELLDLIGNAPVITQVVTDLSIVKNEKVTLTMEFIEAYDANGDPMELLVHEGSNYTLLGTEVSPTLDFIGDLLVPVQVVDTTGKFSQIDTIIISVLPDIHEIQPLFTGATWTYSDTFHTIDSVATSHLEVTGLYGEVVPGISTEIYRMEWRNLDSLQLQYLYTSTAGGLIRVGALSPKSSYMVPQTKLQYPSITGSSWAFSPLRYKIGAGKFFADTDISEMRCTAEEVYVTVPAGLFKCVEYEYSFPYTPSFRSSTIEQINLPEGTLFLKEGNSRSDIGDIVTVKLYYAAGVGYVQNKTFYKGQLVTRKVLTDYTVVEQ